MALRCCGCWNEDAGMSLILEALRKSEAERRRGQAPDLFAELPPATHRRGPALSPWYWLLLALVLCAALAWLLRERWAPPAAPVATSAAGTVAMAPTTSDATTVAAPDAAPGPVVATRGNEVVSEAAADVVQAPPSVDSQPAGLPTAQDTTPVEVEVVPPSVVQVPAATPAGTQQPAPPSTQARRQMRRHPQHAVAVARPTATAPCWNSPTSPQHNAGNFRR